LTLGVKLSSGCELCPLGVKLSYWCEVILWV
jgi:hypothetical protein